jgi:glycosyltransferase involved in cell wall biosynthesis
MTPIRSLSDLPKNTLSVVLPSYNTTPELLLSTIAAIKKTCLPYFSGCEVIIVNDGPSKFSQPDFSSLQKDTFQIIFSSLPTHRGKGAALKYGTSQASGEIIAYLDSDGELAPQAIVNAWLRIAVENVDLVIAKRQLTNNKRPKIRTLATAIYIYAAKHYLKTPKAETQAGFKVFPRKTLRALPYTFADDSTLYETEIVALANLYGLTKIASVDVPYTILRETTMSTRASLKTFLHLYRSRTPYKNQSSPELIKPSETYLKLLAELK